MTPETQRIAIAEACGWKGPQHPDTQKHIANWPHSRGKSIWWLDQNGKPQMLSSVPDYLCDLNAMHEAERTNRFHETGTDNARDFAWELYLVVRPQDDPHPTYEEFNELGNSISLYSLTVPISATAAQRAEAFLRTIDKWEDSA